MKAYVSRETLVEIIKKNTILSKAEFVPDAYQWWNLDDGSFLTWDFILLDRVLVDVEESEIVIGFKTALLMGKMEEYNKDLQIAEEGVDVEVIAECQGKVGAAEELLSLLGI